LGIPILSFFTGGGFLDIGFDQAGFDIIWTNENSSEFADIYRLGMTEWKKSINPSTKPVEISNRKSIKDITASEVADEACVGDRSGPFGIIGGPPCVDFSVGGLNNGGNGIHGQLTKVFCEMIAEIQPDFFLIENVPGLWKTKKHKKYLLSVLRSLRRSKARYFITSKILNALEYGVPQNRERLFVFGATNEFIKKKSIKIDGRRLISDNWFPWPERTYPNARQLLWPTMNEFGSTPSLPENIPLELTVFPLFTSSPSPEELPNGEEFFNPISPKFLQIKEGDDSRKSFKRLHRYRYSPTVWYGNNEVHLHPWKPRRLSVREALRIQTVPDEYVLPGDSSLTSKFKVIANGVPCKLAWAIANSVKVFLQ